MKKLLLTLIVALGMCGSSFAQYVSNWSEFNGNYFPFQGAWVSGIMINGQIINVDDANWDALEVAAFVGDECRGNEMYLIDDYVIEYGDPFPVLDGYPIYYENGGEEVSFQMYDHLNEVWYETCEITYMGDPITILTGEEHTEGWGDPENPIWLNFTSASTPITKEIAANQWYLISSPVGEVEDLTAVDGLASGTFGLFYFDQNPSDGLEWINYNQGTDAAPGFTALELGKGYLYYNGNEEVEVVTLTFPGSAYEAEGAFELDLDYDANAEFPGVNLVGNPFNADATVDRPFYVINDTYDGVIASEESIVPAMEGCFVVASTPEQEPEPKVTFTPVTGWVGGDVEPGEGELKLNLSCNSKVIDRAIVGFGQGNTLPKFQFRNSSKVYIPVDGKDYAVVRSEGMGELPVSFKANENGTYSLSLSSKNTEFSYLHLVDNLTGADQDLLANPSYSFEARTTDYASRFRLVFATANDEDSFAFFSNGSLIINNEGNATLQVIDVTGRIVKCENINGCANVNVDGASGVYMVRLVNGDNVKVQKVVK